MAGITVGGTNDDRLYYVDSGGNYKAVSGILRWYLELIDGDPLVCTLNGSPATEIAVPSSGRIPAHVWPEGVDRAYADTGLGQRELYIPRGGAPISAPAWGDIPGKPATFPPAAHTQTASTITDLQEAVEDFVGNMLIAGGSLTLAYNDTTGKVTLTASGGDAETIRDTIGAALVGTNGVGIAINDAGDTITFTISGLSIAQTTGLQTALDSKLSRDEAGTYATAASSATPTPSGAGRASDFVLTAQAAAAAFAAPSGTPADGNTLQIVIKDNGTARAVTWNAIYKAADELTLPTTTVVGKTHYWLFRYNAATAKWVFIDYRTES